MHLLLNLIVVAVAPPQVLPLPLGNPGPASDSTVQFSLSRLGLGKTVIKQLPDDAELRIEQVGGCLCCKLIGQTDYTSLSRILTLNNKPVGIHYDAYLGNCVSWECTVPTVTRRIATTARLKWYPIGGVRLAIGWENGPTFDVSITP
jgi:hypothetical protein